MCETLLLATFLFCTLSIIYVKLLPVHSNNYHLQQCTEGINFSQILETVCAFASPKPQKIVKGERKSSRSLYGEDSQVFQLVSDSELLQLGCRVSNFNNPHA